METTAKQYEIAIDNAIEISQVLLDMEGGNYVLAMFIELVQELLDEGSIFGAASVIRKLHEAAEIPFEQSVLHGDNSVAWVALFSDALGDALENAVP